MLAGEYVSGIAKQASQIDYVRSILDLAGPGSADALFACVPLYFAGTLDVVGLADADGPDRMTPEVSAADGARAVFAAALSCHRVAQVLAQPGIGKVAAKVLTGENTGASADFSNLAAGLARRLTGNDFITDVALMLTTDPSPCDMAILSVAVAHDLVIELGSMEDMLPASVRLSSEDPEDSLYGIAMVATTQVSLLTFAALGMTDEPWRRVFEDTLSGSVSVMDMDSRQMRKAIGERVPGIFPVLVAPVLRGLLSRLESDEGFARHAADMLEEGARYA